MSVCSVCGGEGDRSKALSRSGWASACIYLSLSDLPEASQGALPVARKPGQERGRTLGEIDVTVSSYLKPVEPKSLAAYRDAGVDQLVLPAFATDSEKMRALVAGLSEQFVEAAGEL